MSRTDPHPVSENGRGMTRSLRRAVRDVILIVLSILIAFWLDGWQQERQERRLLRQHLSALVSEFAETRSQLGTELESVRSSAEGSDALLRMMSDGSATDPEVVSNTALRSLSAGLFTAGHPVLTAMLASGELVDLQNDSLMAHLARWQDRMEHIRTDSRHLERNREETIRDRTVELGTTFGPFVGMNGDAPRRFELRTDVLLADSGLAVGFIARYERAARLADSYRSAMEEADEIVRMLEVEIDRLGGR